MKILILLSVILLIPIQAYSEDVTFNFESICKLTYEEPYYDCSEMWMMVYTYDVTWVKSVDGGDATGFAVWNLPYGKDHEWSICNYFKDLDEIIQSTEICYLDYFVLTSTLTDGCYNGKCRTVLDHELEHLKCECDWHENMTSIRLKQI